MSEKLRTKFPSFKLGYSLLRISRLDVAFVGILQVEAGPVEGQKEKKEGQKKIKKLKNLKTQVTILSKNLQSFA